MLLPDYYTATDDSVLVQKALTIAANGRHNRPTDETRATKDKRTLRVERNLLLLVFLVLMVSVPGVAGAGGASIAVFPLQELGVSRNGVNLALTRELTERLAESGNEIIGMESVMAFMAMNRIRTPGYLDTVNISRLRRDLGAAFILFGTVSERKDRPEARVGLTLNLVRTSDVRAVWAYVNGRSNSEERNILAIDEPTTTAALEALLVTDLLRDWPWQIINEEQFADALELDSVFLRPLNVRPGGEVFCRVRLENTWGNGQPPQVFFKADEQIYPATVGADGISYEGNWVAGEDNGRVPVTLVLDWPVFERTESALLGNYLVDGTLPLFKIELLGAKKLAGRLVFDKQVTIVPRMIVRKQLARWRLSFYFEDVERAIGHMEGEGNLPSGFVWRGMRGLEDRGDGNYRIQVEAWDQAGNMYQVIEDVEMLRSKPQVELALTHSETEVIADLEYTGKVPLSYWRMQMWTEEGKILTQVEGEELPITIDMELPESMAGRSIEGVIFSRDIFGKELRQEVSHFLPSLSGPQPQEENADDGVSESWVDEF